MPKKKKAQKLYSDVMKKYDYFESRWNFEEEKSFYYNPYTGETVTPDDYGYMNRLYSLWSPTEKPSKFTDPITVLPEVYSSRLWGRRRFPPFEDEETAAFHITAVARGFLARLDIRRYYKQRYSKILDPESGYYYYQDNYFPDMDPAWYKPRLAFPDDIEVYEYVPEDPADFLRGKHNKYTYKGFITGPYLKRQLGGIGVKHTERADNVHFVFQNPLRPGAIERPDEVDLDMAPIGAVIRMMDGMSPKEVVVTDYLAIRRACCCDNCDMILETMDKYSARPLVLLYGFMALSKIIVPLDQEGMLSHASRKALNWAFDIISDKTRTVPYVTMTYAAHALYNIMCTSAGRAEFFDVSGDPQGGGQLEGPAGRMILTRMKTICRLLEHLPVSVTKLQVRDEENGKVDEQVIRTPTELSVDLAVYLLMIVALLACNQDMREVVGETMLEAVLLVIQICMEEGQVVAVGLRCLYNFMYRCEVNHQLINSYAVDDLIAASRKMFAGDVVVLRQCRRLELAMKRDGWRGNVEKELGLDEEMREEASQVAARLAALDNVSLLESFGPVTVAEGKFSDRRGESVKFGGSKSFDIKSGGLNDISMISGDSASYAESKG